MVFSRGNKRVEYIFEAITGCSLLSILYAMVSICVVFCAKKGTLEMQQIASDIQEGAKVYMQRQYFVMSGVGFVIAALLALLLSPLAAVGFSVGAILSSFAGFIGVRISVNAGVRTTQAACSSVESAFSVAFRAGTSVGFFVVGLALLGITGFFWYLTILSVSQYQLLEGLLSLSLGTSLNSILVRLGGGIFTKGADAGADIAGKVEIAIPEDDLRNPAVIADNVGDNVGDCAGMVADVFETYVITFAGTMLLAAVYFRDLLQSVMMLYPLMIGVACLFGSLIGTFSVYPGRRKKLRLAMYRGLLVTMIVSAGVIVWITHYIYRVMGMHFSTSLIPFTEINLIICAFTGLGLTGSLIWATEYYTSATNAPVHSIARASLTGHATNIIQGLAVGMEATILPVAVIAIAIIIAYLNAGIFGISIAATAMLSLFGIVVTMNSFGAVVDSSGGIASMARLPQEVRLVTDLLDCVGNTTKAVTKSYAVGSSVLAAFVLFTTYTEELRYYFPHYSIDFRLTDPFVLVGLLMGGLIPFAFCAMALKAVGKAGVVIVLEIRRQFREIPGILAGGEKPNYRHVVDLLTKVAISEMVVPALLPVLAPVVLFSLIRMIAGEASGFICLGSMVVGTILMGVFTSISMTSGGGAWDNAKKLIEAGHYGGKGSYAHRAAMTGDIVGDPCKDTAGPAINPLIKIVSIVAILLLACFMSNSILT